MKLTTVHDCQLMHLPQITDPRGSLTVVESERQVRFPIKRVYYLYDVPGGSERGGHAHKALYQFVVAITGSFDIVLDDGTEKKTIHLNRSYAGVVVPPYIWRVLNNFSSGAVCLVLASDYFLESDYFRNYRTFIRARHRLQEGKK